MNETKDTLAEIHEAMDRAHRIEDESAYSIALMASTILEVSPDFFKDKIIVDRIREFDKARKEHLKYVDEFCKYMDEFCKNLHEQPETQKEADNG